MNMKDDRIRQKTIIHITQQSKIERYYTEHESQIIINKANE